MPDMSVHGKSSITVNFRHTYYSLGFCILTLEVSQPNNLIKETKVGSCSLMRTLIDKGLVSKNKNKSLTTEFFSSFVFSLERLQVAA